MFLFRKNAEPADGAGDHEPVDVTNAAHLAGDEEEEHHALYQHDEAEAEYEEEQQPEEEDEAHVDDYEEGNGEEEEAGDDHYDEVAAAEEHVDEEEEEEEEEEAPHAGREGTVPPLEERHFEEAPAPAPQHASAVPGIAMPRTSPSSGAAHSPMNAVMRRSSRGATPRGTSALSPRSHSRAGQSYAFSAASYDEAEVREQHYRRCSSTVRSARSIGERRASAVNGTIGGSLTADARRRSSGALTAAEREAVERMMENEWRRQEAAERSAHFRLIRENAAVETELEKERAHYALLQERERELRHEIGRRSSLRDQRMAAAAARRAETERQRQHAILASVAEKEDRYHARDPYTVVAAQRRYQSPFRGSVSSGRRGSGGTSAEAPVDRYNPNSNNSADYRRNSAPVTTPRQGKPGIDMSRPKQCLPMNAWKTPEQLQRKARAGSTPHICLPPGAWKAQTMAEHPRQWH